MINDRFSLLSLLSLILSSYNKFVKAKDLNNYSEKDISSIFATKVKHSSGKLENKSDINEEDKKGCATRDIFQTFTVNAVSVGDYFKEKLEQKKVKSKMASSVSEKLMTKGCNQAQQLRNDSDFEKQRNLLGDSDLKNETSSDNEWSTERRRKRKKRKTKKAATKRNKS